MRLLYSNTSPYSRKVRLLILEKELEAQVEGVLINPFKDASALKAFNPLGKIPALVLDNGEVLYDSPLICRYLDSLSGLRPLIPPDGWQHWETLRWEALCDGMTDAAYNRVMERKRPLSEQSSSWLASWSAEIQRVLYEIEVKRNELGEDLTLAHLALGSALGYLDFRLPELLNESECPQTLSWYENFKTRPCMLGTQPKDGS